MELFPTAKPLGIPAEEPPSSGIVVSGAIVRWRGFGDGLAKVEHADGISEKKTTSKIPPFARREGHPKSSHPSPATCLNENDVGAYLSVVCNRSHSVYLVREQ